MAEYTLHLGDCLEVLKTLPDNSVDAIVTDPPYGLSKEPDMAEVLRHWLAGDDYRHKGGGFMGKSWDSFVPGPSIWRECLRVLKPGGHMLAFFGSRTYDMGVLAIRLAGFEIRDQIMWLYGCLDEATEVVTERGVMPYHKTKAGDRVLCYDVEHGEYTYQPILEIVEYDYCDTAYRLIGDFGEQVVSRNHRVIVERGGSEVFQIAETLECEARVPVLEDLSALLQAIHDAHQGTGRPQQDVRGGLCECFDWRGEFKADAAVAAEGGYDRVRGLRGACVEAECLATQGEDADVQQSMQRQAEGSGVGEARTQRSVALVSRVGGCTEDAHDGQIEPIVEGRGYVPQPQGCVCGSADQVCTLPGFDATNGPCGRVRDGAPPCGGTCNRSATHANGMRTPHQPRCNGQPTGKPDAVRHECPTQGVRAWRGHRSAVVRVVPFHYTGKVWCLRVPTGAFVAVRNGVAFPTGNSGFPKSLDVSKAIDKAAGAEREKVKIPADQVGNFKNRSDTRPFIEAAKERGFHEVDSSDPATDAARQWQGWGTALKPAHEPIVVARKPLIGTVAQNVLTHGTGALNIDGCRIGDNAGWAYPKGRGGSGWHGRDSLARNLEEPMAATQGRWPANLIHDGSDDVLSEFARYGDKGAAAPVRRRNSDKFRNSYGTFKGNVDEAGSTFHGDRGTAARFFYCAKASKADRDAGLEGFDDPRRNIHPTVKPTDLMRWLCRLVTPPGGLVLDPFMGSGSTGRGALLEGFRFIGIEMDPDYLAIAEARVSHAKAEREAAKRKTEEEQTQQLSLLELVPA